MKKKHAETFPGQTNFFLGKGKFDFYISTSILSDWLSLIYYFVLICLAQEVILNKP